MRWNLLAFSRHKVSPLADTAGDAMAKQANTRLAKSYKHDVPDYYLLVVFENLI